MVHCCSGRTGQFHAWEYDGFTPNIQVLGKGLGAGEHAIAAVFCNERVVNDSHKSPGRLAHGFMFQNNAVGCASACAFISILRRDMILENVKSLAPRLIRGLRKGLSDHPFVGDARGVRIFVAVSYPQPF